MLKKSSFVVAGLLLAASLCAQTPNSSAPERLFSPSAALTFYEMALDIAPLQSEKTQIEPQQAQKALVFLTAIAQLDPHASYIVPDMMKLACRSQTPLLSAFAPTHPISVDVNDPNALPTPPEDNSLLVHSLLNNYVDSSADLQVTREAIDYLLSRLDTREEKEQLLGELLNSVGSRNDGMVSELATALGLLVAETANVEMAQGLFLNAISKNEYNRLALAKLQELMAEQVPPAMQLGYLRYHIAENPLDLQTAITFATTAARYGIYQLATDAYEYAARLYQYLYPDRPLASFIYLPWAFNAYHTERNPFEALRVAEKMRQAGHFDLVLEAIAAKAAQKTGQSDQAKQILEAAEQRALLEYQAPDADRQTMARQFAWFYCFIKSEPAQAIDWANKAYSQEPNSADAAGLLACALLMNDQAEWISEFFESYESGLVLNLVKGQIELSAANTEAAAEALRAVIDEAPASLEAERAKQLLDEADLPYVPLVDAVATLTALTEEFGPAVLPDFREPNQILAVQLRTKGEKFTYGSDFGASLIVSNISKEQPLIVSDHGLLQGYIRIDARVSGDLNKTIPSLVSKRVLPSSPIEPTANLIVPLRLLTGELKTILANYPQALLDVEFTVYLDPVILEDGTVANRLEDLPVLKTTVRRPDAEITGPFLRNRVSSLKRRRQSQRTAQLFAGLLIEQHIMASGEPLYEFTYADWMPEMLKSSLAYNLSSDDWPARIHTMAAMKDMPLDMELIEAISENLQHEHWPVRLMALYVLARDDNPSFKKVLDYSAQYDESKLVRDMAIALGGKNQSSK